jgi:hypothetical protein
MSDKVQTAVLWFQRIAQFIGLLLTLLGGSQAADIAPAAFGGDGAAAGGNTLLGMALMFLTPAVGWAVKAVYGKTRGKQFTPVADLVKAEAAIVELELQLADNAAALTSLAGIRTAIADVFSKASKAAAPKPALTVDVK